MDQKDHDLLISLNTKVGALCSKIETLDAKFDKSLENCDNCKDGIYNKIGEVDKNNTDFNIFKWIAGTFGVTIVILIGYLVVAGTQINQNTGEIKHLQSSDVKIEERVDDNLKDIKKLERCIPKMIG